MDSGPPSTRSFAETSEAGDAFVDAASTTETVSTARTASDGHEAHDEAGVEGVRDRTEGLTLDDHQAGVKESGSGADEGLDRSRVNGLENPDPAVEGPAQSPKRTTTKPAGEQASSTSWLGVPAGAAAAHHQSGSDPGEAGPSTPRAEPASPLATPIAIPGALVDPDHHQQPAPSKAGDMASSTSGPVSLSAKLSTSPHPADAVSPDHPDPHAEHKLAGVLRPGVDRSGEPSTESSILASSSKPPSSKTSGATSEVEPEPALETATPPTWSLPAGATGSKAVPTMQDASRMARAATPPSSAGATAASSAVGTASVDASPASQSQQRHRPDPLPQPTRAQMGLGLSDGFAPGTSSSPGKTVVEQGDMKDSAQEPVLAVTQDGEELLPPRPPAMRRDSSGSGSGFGVVDDSTGQSPRPDRSPEQQHTTRRSYNVPPPVVSVAGPAPEAHVVPASPRNATAPAATASASPRSPRQSSSREASTLTASPAQPTAGRSRRQLGEYTLGKTLGAGSMGKVKLGVSATTGEKIAIKIIPRHTSMAAAQAQAHAAAAWAAEKEKRLAMGLPMPLPGSDRRDADGGDVVDLKRNGTTSRRDKEKDAEPVPPTKSFLAKAHAKDVSKEVRTIREASIVLLLHHPYVCGMKSMLVYPHHYYMLFEYVNGGQMLDYIISHGRLRERAARKFARQIGSALEYCHANSIVHRDLKIENILISKTGNIKIIDFGLSNLFSPHSNLSTFCGSLYFAAPELLNAKVYTGPEVDVWSFGIVLYVLVCGKVPFDDQSMPALHAKIKRGQLEYPAWLSTECKHLLSRMLVTNPQNRAQLSEVLSHAWIVKGYDGSPSSHLPHREPLLANELDPDVVRGMTGFEFGTPEEIEQRLRRVLTSDLYLQVVRIYQAKKGATEVNGAANGIKKESKGDPALPRAGRSPSKRFSGLGFYGKKMAGGLAAVLGSGKDQEKSASETSSLVSTTDAHLANGTRVDSLDPTRGFHPLISVYYLVREKIEREKIYGAGVFASSTLSLTGPPPPPAPPSVYRSSLSPMTAEFPTMPSPSLASASPRVGPPSSAPQPRRTGVPLSAPKSPTARARASADDYGGEEVLSTKPLKHRASHDAGVAASAPNTLNPPNNVFGRERPSNAETDRRPSSRSIGRRSSQVPTAQDASGATDEGTAQTTSNADLDKDRPLSAGSTGTFARRFGSLLGRSSSMADSDFKRHRHRSSIGGTGHKAGTKAPLGALPQVSEGEQQVDEDKPLALPGKGQGVNRSSTVGSPPSSRIQPHQRGVSVGGSATVGRAASASVSVGRPRMASLQGGKTQRHSVLRESDEDDATVEAPGAGIGRGRPTDLLDRSSSSRKASDKIKPVYLKGLFSVATTSTKSPQVIRDDIVRVLDQIGIQHRDIKGGFECAHAPSIDLSSLPGNQAVFSPTTETGSPGFPRRSPSMKRKSSFARHAASPAPTQQETLATNQSEASLPHSQVGAQTRTASSSSFGPLGRSSNAQPTTPRPDTNVQPDTPVATVNNDMIVRFEVFIVKMPLLPGIHGVQFRRISGNAWQYSLFARRILQELKL